MSHRDLTKRMEFDFIKKIRLAVKIWLIRNEWLSKTLKSELKKTIYRYVSKDCLFTLNINILLKEIRLTKFRYYIYLLFTYFK